MWTIELTIGYNCVLDIQYSWFLQGNLSLVDNLKFKVQKDPFSPPTINIYPESNATCFSFAMWNLKR